MVSGLVANFIDGVSPALYNERSGTSGCAMKLETSKVWRRWDLQENCSNSSMVGLLEINDCLRKLIWRAEGMNHCFTVKNSIGKRPISPLTASLVDFWLIPSKYLHKYRFNFGRTWCLSVLFKEQLFVHFDLLSKNGLQTSIAYVMIWRTSLSNSEIVHGGCCDILICLRAKNALHALSCKVGMAWMKVPQDEKIMPK